MLFLREVLPTQTSRLDSVIENMLTYATGASRLATPWKVALIRAQALANTQLPNGLIVDPACGSGIQLAAFASTLDKSCIGIELSEPTGQHAVNNLAGIFSQCNYHNEWSLYVGDGRTPEDLEKIMSEDLVVSFLHLDPARPENSRTHALDEMAPNLDEILEAWKPYLQEKPAIMLDLSPRLLDVQRLEVESIVERYFAGIEKTWEWVSRGQGRVDRLALWLGLAAEQSPHRFVRVPFAEHQDLEVIRGVRIDATQRKREHADLLKGDYLSILDAALVASGLAEQWIQQVLPTDEWNWIVDSGRRPTILHRSPLNYVYHSGQSLIQSTGIVIEKFGNGFEEKNLETWLAAMKTHGIGKITLRFSLQPEIQQKIQRHITSNLEKKTKKEGFLWADEAGIIYLCA
ncbi:MAG TPA: class I SAM-dependent methyltransferase [Candidatus Poseidoniales archaeon]|nr:MAG TPA: class I SAM-dependent methyltransferase [Candidatus Poseidoniales archaeon]